MKKFYSLLIVGISCFLLACSGNNAVNSNSANTSNKSSFEAKIIAPEEGEKLLYNDGRSVLLKASPGYTGSQKLLVGTEKLPNGTAIPVHSHDEYEEVIFVHEGNAFLTLGDQRLKVQPGTTMYIPPGTWHGVESADPKQTTMLFIFPEVKIADFFRFAGHHEGEEPKNLTAEDWEHIMKKHKMRARSN